LVLAGGRLVASLALQQRFVHMIFGSNSTASRIGMVLLNQWLIITTEREANLVDGLPLFQHRNKITHFPKLVSDICGHRGRDAKRLMDADEVLIGRSSA
jgi:hypothetical protein